MSEATKVTPFFANKGYHPRMGFEKLPATRIPQELQTDKFTLHMKELEGFLKSKMQFAQANYKTATNRHQIPAPAYQVGDKVWLSTRNLYTKRPSQKLDMRWAGSFKIKRVISPYNYELNLPKALQVHPVFYVNLIDLMATDLLEGHQQEPPPLLIIDGEEKWLVEDILDSQKIRGSFNYLVK